MNAYDILDKVVIFNNECLVYPTKTRSIRKSGKMVSISRIVYEEFIGVLPKKSRILRICNNGDCLNPEHMLPSSPEDKFWSHVDKSGECWEWVGSKDGGGYGCFGSSLSTERKAHRLAWMIITGRKIPNGLHVLHHCDNPACVKIEHLFLGKNVDNVRDKMKKGRFKHLNGEQNGRCKLTKNDVLKIRELHGSGTSYRQLCGQFNVGMTQIGRIVRRESWSWL